MSLKVGDKIWHWNPDRRIYSVDAHGRSTGRAIYAKHWVEVEIVGETSMSWLVGPEWHPTKISKKHGRHGYAFTRQEVDDDIYLNEHRRNIAGVVECLKDANVLRAIATQVNYKVPA